MRKYTWDEYYEKFYDWATSTQIKHISDLTSYGSPDEITECVIEFCDEKAGSRLINKALDAGVIFGVSNLEDLLMSVNDETINRLVDNIQGELTDSELDALAGCLDDAVFAKLLKKNANSQYTPDVIMEILDTTDDEIVKQMALEANGYFSSEQLIELQCHFDDKTIETLIKKSLGGGIKFPPEDVIEWTCVGISKDILKQIALAVDGKYTPEQAEELYNSLPETDYREIAEKFNLDLHEEVLEIEYVYEAPKPKLGFFGTLFAVIAGIGGNSNNGSHRHNGRCNGDCANCPPHYGYRYGRWYYGHCHQHGCEFGGNRGDGSMD